MRLRIPLFGKVLFWFLLNLLVIGAIGYGFARAQFRLGLEWLLAGASGQRLEAMAELITSDLRERPVERWGEVTEKYAKAQHLQFAIFRNDARQVAGEPIAVPAEVERRLRDRRGPPARREEEPRAQANRPPREPPPARIDFFLRAGTPARYWAGIHIGLTHADPVDPRPLTLLLVGDTITGGGLFVPLRPWLMLLGATLLISVIVWLPLVGGMTRAIQSLGKAARRIAEGEFGVRVPAGRRDELGDLAASVNTMATRLGAMVENQRRFTADVAHELCSPIARMQRAVALLEQRASDLQAPYLQRVDQELQHMARLVEEVLSFSKTTASSERKQPADCDLGELLQKIVQREAAESEIWIHLPHHLALHTLKEPLDRAISNVVRNAVRYAGSAGPIEITASEEGERVEIHVRDHGPGVPAESLEKIFEPFYRPEVARDRRTGGAGLGLAIVRRCVELCGGSARAELPEGGGLRIVLSLPRTPAASPQRELVPALP